MSLLWELLRGYPSIPDEADIEVFVEVCCAACWRRHRRVQRLGRFRVDQHIGKWVALDFGGHEHRGCGRARIDIAPNRNRYGWSDVLYEWGLPERASR
jgi:hypothetical protein